MSAFVPTPFTANLLAAVDSLDAEAWLGFLTDDVAVRFGNAETLQGKDAVRAMLAGHFATIDTMRHEVLAEHRDGDVVVQELRVTVARKGAPAGTVPGANVLRLRGDLVADYRVYIDLSEIEPAAG